MPLAAAPLRRPLAADVIGENLPHRLGGDCEKMRPILPLRTHSTGLRPRCRITVIHHLDVGVVHQGRGLQGVAGLLMLEEAARQRPQLLIDQGEQAIGGGAVAVADRRQKHGQFMGIVLQMGEKDFLGAPADFCVIGDAGGRLRQFAASLNFTKGGLPCFVVFPRVVRSLFPWRRHR